MSCIHLFFPPFCITPPSPTIPLEADIPGRGWGGEIIPVLINASLFKWAADNIQTIHAEGEVAGFS